MRNAEELTGSRCFAGFNRSKTMNQVKQQYLEKNYDLSKTIVISNSDGGAGYDEGVFAEIAEGSERHEHFRDRYHVNKKIKERLNFAEKALVNTLQSNKHCDRPFGKSLCIKCKNSKIL